MTQLRVISLGAGVQSTTMALMAAHGEIGPMPDCAIFADTGAEPRAVYDHLRWLMSPNVLPFPVHIVERGNLRADNLANARGEKTSGKLSTIPAFTMGVDGRAAPLSRQCTRDYKIDPIVRKLRRLFGVAYRQRIPKGARVEQWIGISTDEAHRMKPSHERWIEPRWPLIEQLMSRGDCLRWLERNDYPQPPKSACTFCPYHSDSAWAEMRNTDPEGWADAIAFDKAIRGGFKGTRGEVFLHRSLKPLDEVVFANDNQPDLFGNECEGMCGV